MIRTRTFQRTVVTLLSGALAAVVAATPAVASSPTLNRADAAAGWLARQMVDGDHFEATFGEFTFPDQGLTIDAIFAFAATKTADSYAGNALTWLAQPAILSGYIGDGTTESYAGATAKASLAVQVRGGNPTSFGGVNLTSRLLALRTPSGRFSDRSAFGDFSNAFSQSLAILTLERTPAGAPAPAAAFLAGSRCADGGYPITFGEPTCVSDVDATAIAVQALRAAGRYADAFAGTQWLISAQAADGSFVNAGGIPNTNSTGLAGQALRTGGRLLAAAKAAAFIRGQQVNCGGAAADRGAIAFTTGGLDPNTAPRATAQAILGLTGPSLATLSAAGSSPAAKHLACP
ncbi:prenyltransferase/squalene oxidase repeat-containing protein [Phytohabitans suffuscus]|uniref:Peptidase n=1 Tax=Phytohabitans suffuscus TaxID=624315 RepID=A0A6F8YT54_9ACTN|nr:peptidase [Phytohabitans suffuscus]BCB89292.1 hypothetical protein Psuf_066050 [Phytohabitans suffuscus]